MVGILPVDSDSIGYRYMKPGLFTEELAEKIGIKPQSIRAHIHRKGGRNGGNYCGIVPRRMKNGRLLWPHDAVDRLITESTDQSAAEAGR